MNKVFVILLAFLGAINIVIDVIIPILLVLIWQKVFGITTNGAYVLYGMAMLASVFRGIKVWMK